MKLSYLNHDCFISYHSVSKCTKYCHKSYTQIFDSLTISYYATLYDMITKHIHVFHEALTKHSDHLPGGMHHDTPNAPKQEGSSGGTVSLRKMDITIAL